MYKPPQKDVELYSYKDVEWKQTIDVKNEVNTKPHIIFN
jgi:hypothetical protein